MKLYQHVSDEALPLITRPHDRRLKAAWGWPCERCAPRRHAHGGCEVRISLPESLAAPVRGAGCIINEPGTKRLIVQEASQLPRPARMLELAQRLGLDLADALARHRELLADLFQRVVGVHADSEAHAQHALFAWRQRGEHARRGLAQVRLDGGVDRQDRVLVLDEI